MESQTTSAAALRDPRLKQSLCAIVLLALVAIVFGRAAGFEFVNLDDDKFISANANYLHPTLESLAHFWRALHAHLYVPVTMSVWWLIAQNAAVRAGGAISLNPWIFHAASLLVHATNVLLVWQLLRRLFRDDVAAAIGAALFAVHPFQVETVAWASEMKDLLAAMFSLLALLAMLATSQASGTTSRRRMVFAIIAVACFAAALLSKPSVVTLPLVAVVILWATGARPRVCWSVLAIGFVMAIPVMLVARWAQPAADVTPPALGMRPLVAADALAFYLGKLIWPFWCAVDYGRTPAAIVASHAIVWTWIFPVIMTVAIFLSRQRWLIAAWLIFIGAALANLGLVSFDFQIVSTVADHYVYFSMLGVSVAVAYVASTLPRARMPLAGVLALLAIVSCIQVGHWSDSESLWRHAIDVNSRSGLATGNLGAVLFDRGDAAGALPLLQRAAALDPNDPFALMNLARAKLALHDNAGAAQSLFDLEAAYRRRADFNADLTAAVLDHFADELVQEGDLISASRLRDESARLRKP